MKENDFEKCLDNLIIDGLIKEAEQENAEFEAAMRNMSEEDFLELIHSSRTQQSQWKLWVGAIASIAAILLIVLIPAVHNMDSKICQSALIASSSYFEPSRGTEIASMQEDEIKVMIPELQQQYVASKNEEDMSFEAAAPNEEFTEEYYISHVNHQEAAMDLVHAYLKLNEKDKAIEVLHELSDKYGDSDFGNHCRMLLEILE